MTVLPVENVQDYPRPPALRAMSHHVRVEFGGQTIAGTDRAYCVLETHHAPTYYIPANDIDAVLAKSGGQSFCEWKGVATYWDIQSGMARATKAAWNYATRWLWTYNNERPNVGIGGMTPIQKLKAA